MTFRSISHRGTVSTLLPELLRFTQRITHGIVGWQVLPTNIATPPKWDANFWKVGTRVGVKLEWKYLKIHENSLWLFESCRFRECQTLPGADFGWKMFWWVATWNWDVYFVWPLARSLGFCMMSLHSMGDLDHQKSGTCLGPSVLRTAICLFETGNLCMFSGKLREKNRGFWFRGVFEVCTKMLTWKGMFNWKSFPNVWENKIKVCFSYQQQQAFFPKGGNNSRHVFFLFQAGPTFTLLGTNISPPKALLKMILNSFAFWWEKCDPSNPLTSFFFNPSPKILASKFHPPKIPPNFTPPFSPIEAPPGPGIGSWNCPANARSLSSLPGCHHWGAAAPGGWHKDRKTSSRSNSKKSKIDFEVKEVACNYSPNFETYKSDLSNSDRTMSGKLFKHLCNC